MEQKYIIIESSELETLDWGSTYQTLDSIRMSPDNTLGIISVDVDSNYMGSRTSYTHSEIRVILEGDNWKGVVFNEDTGSSD
tara:strand:+ start:52 stop:297 length:246 start_codon:yes stop_codon:yes gene_type:complete